MFVSICMFVFVSRMTDVWVLAWERFKDTAEATYWLTDCSI